MGGENKVSESTGGAGFGETTERKMCSSAVLAAGPYLEGFDLSGTLTRTDHLVDVRSSTRILELWSFNTDGRDTGAIGSIVLGFRLS